MTKVRGHRRSGGRLRVHDEFVEVRRPDRIARILRRLIAAKAERRIESILVRLHPADIAKVMTFLSVAEARRLIDPLFRLRKGASTFVELPESYLQELLEVIDPRTTAEIVRRLDPDDAVDLLQALSEEKRREVLRALNIEEVEELQRLLAYEEDTAGAIMNPEVFALPIDITVAEAIQRIRQAGDALETVFYLYVVDRENHLVGTVSMRQLLLADPETRLAEVVDETVLSVTADASTREVAEIIAKYDLLAVPVVDRERHLIGVITVDDVVDVIQEAATEELYRLAALDEDDRVFSPPGRSVRLRLPWLTLNFFTAVLAAATVSLFEETIAQVVALASMMPIVAGMGGNAGTQTLTVVIRGLALGELSGLNARRAIVKEALVGLIDGVVLGVIGGVLAWWWRGAWWLGLLLALSMVVNLVVAGLGGALIPLVLRRLRLDPALGSSIFLTTLTDIFGFFTFLGLATWLLPRLGVG